MVVSRLQIQLALLIMNKISLVRIVCHINIILCPLSVCDI